MEELNNIDTLRYLEARKLLTKCPEDSSASRVVKALTTSYFVGSRADELEVKNLTKNSARRMLGSGVSARFRRRGAFGVVLLTIWGEIDTNMLLFSHSDPKASCCSNYE